MSRKQKRGLPLKVKPGDPRLNFKAHPNLLKHSWQKGQSGNPGGRPRGTTLMTYVRSLLKQRAQCEDGSSVIRIKKVAEAYVKQMEAGSFHHLREYIDREEGRAGTQKPAQNLKVYVNMPTGEDARDDNGHVRRALPRRGRRALPPPDVPPMIDQANPPKELEEGP